MTGDREFAPAKVNLSLQVVGKREDGYHLLNSLVAFCDIGDMLSVSTCNHDALQISGKFERHLDASPKNLVWLAVELLKQFAEPEPGYTAITLEKNLPVASGIGGGSADAAAALRLMSRYWQLTNKEVDLEKIALSLGADVPMCLHSKPANVSGIGERIDMVSMPSLHLVLANPGVELSTREVFENATLSAKQDWETKTAFSNSDEVVSYLCQIDNDLESSAIELAPEISECINVIDEQPRAMLARMSGSGATCFGIFPTARDAALAQKQIKAQHPDWWVKNTRTLN